MSRQYRQAGLSGTDVILRGGESLVVREVHADDRELIRRLFYGLTPTTRYLRYQYSKETITEEELDVYTTFKPPTVFSYVAITGQAEQRRIVAIASTFLIGSGPRAEVAFLVEDSIQLRGIGTAMLEKLAATAQKHRKITSFYASVLPENTRMLGVFMDSGFIVQRTFDEGVYSLEIDLKEQQEYARRQALREHIARSAGVRRFLNPLTVAVIGASRNPQSVGGAVFRNMLHGGFQGAVFPVNPHATSIAGVLAYPTVLDIPADVDLAVVVVAAPLVQGVIEQCAQRGIDRVVIISAGFAEAGPEGRLLQQAIKETALAHGMRIIGPNCLGIINTDPAVGLNATFSPVAQPPAGSVCIASHSGALGLALIDYASVHKLGLRGFVSIGNRIDISSNDLLEYWEDDPEARVIALYLESFGNPRKFSRLARRVSRSKPIIAVKSGRSDVGARAASSHTGALAAADVAVDALFQRAGVIRVNTIQEMFNAVRFLAHQPAPQGPRVGILTNAGGPGVLAADAAVGWRLEVPPLTQETQNALREFLPSSAAVGNPVDMIASASATSYGKALRIMLEDPGIDAVIFIYIPPLVTRPADVALSVKQAMADYRGNKPVLACFMMLADKDVDLSVEGGRMIPSYVFPEDAVQALGRAYQYLKQSRLQEGRIVTYPEVDGESVRQGIVHAYDLTEQPQGRWMHQESALQLLEQYGIPVARARTAGSAQEAAAVAAEIGFPVVMKVRSERIIHKSDVGGIALMLESEQEVQEAYGRMMTSLRSHGVLEQAEGVIVQQMVSGGTELIVGMIQDPLFGPLIMLGMGGISVETGRDIAFALHPLSDLDPDRMIESLRAAPVFAGIRGMPALDVPALHDTLLRFSAMVEDIPEIDQMEMNPCLIFEEGRGIRAVDARILLKQVTEF